MLVIRLRRTGKKGQPNYRIVVTDSRKAVYSPYIANVGTYDPRTKKIILDKDLTMDWMNKGAKPSNTVAKLLEKEGLKHNSIVIKKFRAISKKELEKQKAAEEVEKAREQAEKEAAKEAFEAQVEQEKKEADTVDPLLAAADEAIAEIKEEEKEAAPTSDESESRHEIVGKEEKVETEEAPKEEVAEENTNTDEEKNEETA